MGASLDTALILFIANGVFSGDDREVITVKVTSQEYLVTQRQNLMYPKAIRAASGSSLVLAD
jgi:hypothetical protein